jgi:hypothetical protein
MKWTMISKKAAPGSNGFIKYHFSGENPGLGLGMGYLRAIAKSVYPAIFVHALVTSLQ